MAGKYNKFIQSDPKAANNTGICNQTFRSKCKSVLPLNTCFIYNQWHKTIFTKKTRYFLKQLPQGFC